MRDILIKEIKDMDELWQIVELEREIWGMADIDNMAPGTLKAAIGAGGLALGAYDKEKMVAFAFGFPSFKNDALGLGFHSHILGVAGEYRSLGLGRKLKLWQREWCLERGIKWMTWTFDPLQAKNAKFNIEYLGARSNTYKINEYGVMGGELNAELPSDRLLAFWELTDAGVLGLIGGRGLEPTQITTAEKALIKLENGEPQIININRKARRVLIEVPENINDMLKTRPELALKWRMAAREQLTKYFDQGYLATRFLDNNYVLEKKV